jgi:uncharacterized protein YmfQ (DUF2313 family)
LTVIRSADRESAFFVWPEVATATSYKVYYTRSLSVSGYSVLITQAAQVTAEQYAVADDLDPDTMYTFKVTAVNGDGEGEASAEAQDF